MGHDKMTERLDDLNYFNELEAELARLRAELEQAYQQAEHDVADLTAENARLRNRIAELEITPQTQRNMPEQNHQQ